jgi:thymidylate synthase
MTDFYKPYQERRPDTQYQDRLRFILEHGTRVETPQGVDAITCFGTLPQMVFDLRNGVPLITERSCERFWRKAVAEIIAFMHGARTLDELERYGTDVWKDYRGKGIELGLEADDLGPGSYGAAFHDYEIPEEAGGGTLDQFEQVVDQIRRYPSMRTHLVTPWKPYYTARGPRRKVIVAPCHGWLHFRVIDGKLHMRMDQRSADMPIGVPSNMIQYAALLLMVSHVTGYEPGLFIHSFADAHIYEDQVDKVRAIIERKPYPFPVLRFNREIRNLRSFSADDFTLEEYDAHPGMKIPYQP